MVVLYGRGVHGKLLSFMDETASGTVYEGRGRIE